MISWGAGILAAALVVTAASAHLSAQGATIDKRTFLTFSAPVQVPGATLPAGTYVFRIVNPGAQTVWEVLDATERHVLAQFFFVRTADRTIQEQNRAHGRPVVRFHETPRGVAPPMKGSLLSDRSRGSYVPLSESAGRANRGYHPPARSRHR
jgi:hypothetical protein